MRIVVAAVVVMTLAGTAPAIADVGPAGPAEFRPMLIVMRDQLSAADVRELRQGLGKPARRTAVIGALKALAARTQANVCAELRAGQRAGVVGERIQPLWLTNLIAADLTDVMIDRVASRPDVDHVVPDLRFGREAFPVEPVTDPGFSPDGMIACGIDLIRADRVWNQFGITGLGSVVCVIDSGCCITHPDLANQIWVNIDEIPGNGVDDDQNGFIDDIHGWNFADGGNNDVSDPDGHGTHVAGTVGGDGTGGLATGVAPDAAMMIVRYWSGSAFESTVWASMQYALDNGADVVTGSIGLYHHLNPNRALWRANCDNAIAAGLVVIFAAGNAGDRYAPYDSVATPADVPDVIAVGATDCVDGHYVKYSSMGPVTWQSVPPYNDWPYPPGRIKPTVAAPGDEIRSTSNDCAGYTTMSGTSMATPHVAGTAALMLQANPRLDHFDVKRILEAAAIDMGDPGPDNIYGAGRVNARAAVAAALAELCEPCDANCDGAVDAFDVEPFVQLLTGAAPCASCTGDANGDGTIDAFDIEPFITCLVGP